MARFDANNNMSAYDTFQKRKHFQDNAYTLVDEQLLMDLMYENPMYGKVDPSFDAVYPNVGNLRVYQQSSRSNFGLNFVVDAFTALRKHISQASYLRKIDIKRSFIGDFTAESAYVSAEDMYRNHLESYIGIFSTTYLFSDLRKQSKITTFDDFFAEFRKFIFEYAGTHPLTMTNFIKSRHCSSGISGLIVQISDDPESDDDIKMRNYINDKNFNFYINAARKFGFYVDKNCPWRLIADVSSSRMFEFMRLYGLGSVKELFASYYTVAYKRDIFFLKQILFNMYNEFVDEFPFAARNYLIGCSASPGRPTIQSQNFSATTSHIPRQTISQSEFEKSYPDIFWLLFYLNLRLVEARFRPAPNSLRLMERDIVRRYKIILSSNANDYSIAYDKMLHFIDREVMRVSQIRHRRAKVGAELYLSETDDRRLIDQIRGVTPGMPSYAQRKIIAPSEADPAGGLVGGIQSAPSMRNFKIFE